MAYQILSLGLLAVFYGCYFSKLLRQRRQGVRTDQMGRGKTGFARAVEISLKSLSILTPLAEVFYILRGVSPLPGLLRAAGAVLAAAGTAVFALAVLGLGDSWRAGVSPDEDTALVTGGIYRCSRNPAFLGFDLLYLGILLLFFSWPLLLLSALTALTFHLQIVSVEEPHLQAAFGADYLAYQARVGRYCGPRLHGWRREAAALLCAVLAVALGLGLLTRLLIPKRHDFGSVWGHFLEEEEHSIDVLFYGSSMVYCDVVPAVLWRETGLSAYVMAGPEQTIPMTEYYLRETLRTQSPQAVCIELTGMFFPRYTNYTKTNVDQMPWGLNRLRATFREAEPALRAGLLFPLIFYHDRWAELTADDFRTALLGYEPDPLAGYTFLDAYVPTDETPADRTIVRDEENWARNWEALLRIHALCRERGIQPVYYVAPALDRIPADAMEPLKEQAAALEGAVVLDCNDHFPEIAADGARDYHDRLHYNAAGAEKFSAFLGRWLRENLALTPAEGRDAALWQARLDHFAALASQPMQAQAAS